MKVEILNIHSSLIQNVDFHNGILFKLFLNTHNLTQLTKLLKLQWQKSLFLKD